MNTRRNFLKTSLLGAGACAFMPYIDAIGASKAGSSFPKRFVFIRKSNGLHPFDLYLPSLGGNSRAIDPMEADLDKHELPPTLQPLNEYKEHMTVLQGMSSKIACNGHESWQSIMGLCKTRNGDINTLKRASIDFELAKLFPSPLGHIELSFCRDRHGIVTGYSIPAPYQKNFCYADPITAYENIFQCVLNPSALSMDNDMFAFVQKSELSKSRLMKGEEENAYKNHVNSISAIQTKNRELMKLASKVAEFMPDKEMIYSQGTRSSPSVKKQEAMTEILISVLASGLSNVITYTIDDLYTKQTGIPGNEKDVMDLHDLGHNKSYSGVSARDIREKIRIHHMNQIKTIVSKLKAIPEGKGNMFDNTMIMYFPEGGEQHHGHGTQSPWLVMSGRNCSLDIAGRYIRLPHHGTEGHQTLGNWYTSLLNAHGNPIHHYGDLDSTMTVKRLPQEGPIKRFMKKA